MTDEDSSNPEVQFILKVKSSKKEPTKKTAQVIRQTSSVLIPPHGSSSSSSGTDDSVDDDDDDRTSVAGTETTETTLVGDKNDAELQEQVKRRFQKVCQTETQLSAIYFSDRVPQKRTGDVEDQVRKSRKGKIRYLVEEVGILRHHFV